VRNVLKQIDVIGTITDYNSVTGEFKGTIGTDGRMFMAMMYDFIDGKQWRMVLGKYYKLRTTGPKSQSHKANGYIQQLCYVKGWDFDMMKDWLKRKSIRRGTPFKTDPDGEAVAISETKMTTKDIQCFIDEIEQFAAEENVWLYEGVG